MAKYWTSKYGTKINITGLTPEQVKRVQSTAQDNGAYGAKAASLADSLRKKNGAGGAAGGGKAQQGYNLGVDKKTGAIDPGTATTTVTNAVEQDTQKTFNLQNPGSQTDALGNQQTITTDPTTGQTSITQQAGAGLNAANQAFTGAANQFASVPQQDIFKQAADANYKYLTQYNATDKAREMEAAKQELAQRGIPIDPTPGSLWSKSLEGIDRKYRSLNDQAMNQAITTGNQTLQTQAGVVSTLGSTVAGQTPQFTQYQGGQSSQGATLLSLLNTISSADLAKYGIDQDTATKLKQIAASRSSGGGGGGGGDGGIIFGGTAP